MLYKCSSSLLHRWLASQRLGWWPPEEAMFEKELSTWKDLDWAWHCVSEVELELSDPCGPLRAVQPPFLQWGEQRRSAVKLLLTNTKGLTPLLLNWTLATVLYLRQGWIGWMGRGVKASVWVRSGGEGKRRDRERGIVWKITQVKGATVSQQCGGSVRDTVTNRLRQRCVFREDAQSQK